MLGKVVIEDVEPASVPFDDPNQRNLVAEVSSKVSFISLKFQKDQIRLEGFLKTRHLLNCQDYSVVKCFSVFIISQAFVHFGTRENTHTISSILGFLFVRIGILDDMHKYL